MTTIRIPGFSSFKQGEAVESQVQVSNDTSAFSVVTPGPTPTRTSRRPAGFLTPPCFRVMETMWKSLPSSPPSGKRVLRWDLRNSVFQKNGIYLYDAILCEENRKGSVFTLHISYQVQYAFHLQYWVDRDLHSLEDALYSLCIFLDENVVCCECARVVPKTSTVEAAERYRCASCALFEGFCVMQNKEPETCGICLEPVYRFTLPCGHMFHRLCLMSTPYKEETRCALCRADVPLDVLTYIYDDKYDTRHVLDDHDDNDEDNDEDNEDDSDEDSEDSG